MKNNPKLLFLLCAKSGAGKDSILKEIISQLGLKNALSFTTRPPRIREQNMVDYEFISQEDFKYKLQNNEIAEYVTYDVVNDQGLPDKWHYGLSMNQLTKDEFIITIVNPIGKKTIENMPEFKDKIVSILIDADDELRLKRILNRDNMTNEKCKEMCRRYFSDEDHFKDIYCDYIVYNNGELKECVQKVKEIIVEEMARVCL